LNKASEFINILSEEEHLEYYDHYLDYL